MKGEILEYGIARGVSVKATKNTKNTVTAAGVIPNMKKFIS